MLKGKPYRIATGTRGQRGLTGGKGDEVELRVSAGYLQWKYTKDSTWINLIAVPVGGADVFGPAIAVDSNIAEFDTTTGKLIKDSALTHANVASAISLKHAAVTVSAPISVSTQALSLVNDAAATITEIDTGALDVTSDVKIPTSKAAATMFAPKASPTFTGLATFDTVKITGGTPGVGQVLTSDADGDATWEAAGGGDTRWTQTTGTFTAAPASTSTLTMTTDLTASILVGYALKYAIGGVTYYGVCTAIAANLLTIAGAPLGGDVTALYYGNSSCTQQLDLVVNGYYEDASNATLLATDVGTVIQWRQTKAYAVMYKVYSRIHDSHATHGKATVLINAAELNTSAGGLTIAANATWYSTIVDIDSAAYDINYGEAIELSVTKGGTGDAIDLTVSILFVLP